MIKFSQEESLEELKDESAEGEAGQNPAPEGGGSEAEPLSEDEERKIARLKMQSLTFIEAGLKEAEGKGFLGASKVGVADGISSAVTSLLSGGLPSVNPLAGRIKSKKNIGVEYNSEYNKKAREEFVAIMTDLRTILKRRFNAFLEVTEASIEKEPLGDDKNSILDNYYNIISNLILSKNKVSHLLSSSPSGIILNVMIPEIIALFKAVGSNYQLVKSDNNPENIKLLYSSIKSLESFSNAYEGERLEYAVRKKQRESARKKLLSNKGKKNKSKEEPNRPSGSGTSTSGPKRMLIRRVIPLRGFDDETMSSTGDYEKSILKAKDPLLGDLIFGIDFVEDISNKSADELLKNMMISEGVKITTSLSKNDISSNIIEHDGENILEIIFSRRGVLSVRDSGDKHLFTVDGDSSAKMPQVVTAKPLEETERLRKISSTSTTTPLYQSRSPSGESISFTPADLVAGGGYLTDSKGKKFKPKKIKGKSLSSRVMSKGFGKTKK